MKNGADGDPAASNPDVFCAAIPVDVEGKQAVWIFTEFETKEPLKTLREWLLPKNWTEWGEEMFKAMRPIGSLNLRRTPGDEHQIESKYLEVVEIQGQRLETELRCEYKSAKKWAATTYDLDRSIGNVLQVDRGYLMVADVGKTRHVKALKVIGFTDTLLNTAAEAVCPGWSTWVQRATEEAAVQANGGEVDPKPTSIGDSDPRVSWSRQGAAAFTGGMAAQWIGTVTDMVDFYAPFTVDVGERFYSGRYSRVDAANDTSRLFQRLARDWSVAWQTGLESIASWAQVTVRPTAGADPGRSGRSVERTTLMVKARSDDARVSLTDLTRIGSTPATIKASQFKITPAVIEKKGAAYVTIEADTTDVPAGLYQGSLAAGAGGKEAPALFYVSHAQPFTKPGAQPGAAPEAPRDAAPEAPREAAPEAPPGVE